MALTIKPLGRKSATYHLGSVRYYGGGRRRRRRKGTPGEDDLDDYNPDDETCSATIGDFDPDDLPGEPAGIWMGSGAEKLGLVGEVLPNDLHNLMAGFDHRTGYGLVQNAGKDNRRPGYDCTWSEGKSFAIVSCGASGEERERWEQSEFEADRDTIAFIEKGLVYGRKGRGGKKREKIGLVVAAFSHITSRELQPLPHDHCLILNLGVDRHGKVRAIEAKQLFHYKHFLGAYRLAAKCHYSWDLGYKYVREGSTVEVYGVPKKLRKHYSLRREQILADLKRQGTMDPRAADSAAEKTRRKKVITPPRNQLRKGWRAENDEFGFTAEKQQKLRRKNRPRATKQQIRKGLERARDALIENLSHYSRKQFLIEAMLEGAALGVHPDAMIREARQFLRTDGKVTPAGLREGQQRYTNQEVLDEERFLLREFKKICERPGYEVPADIVEKILATKIEFTREQREAFRHSVTGCLGNNGGAYRAMCGVPGSGKTSTVLQAVADIFWNANIPVFGVTPTGSAVEQLQQALGIETFTVSAVLGDFPQSKADRVYWGLLNPPKPKKFPKAVIILDEQGMMGTLTTAKFFEWANRNDVTVIGSGDWRQLQPPERGAPFRSLIERERCAELKNLVRQKTPESRAVVEQFVHGNAAEGLRLLQEQGRLHSHETGLESRQALSDVWTPYGTERPDRVIVLTNTNAEAELINENLQFERLMAGQLSGTPATIQDRDMEGKVWRAEVYVGDRVVFTRNDTRLGEQPIKRRRRNHLRRFVGPQRTIGRKGPLRRRRPVRRKRPIPQKKGPTGVKNGMLGTVTDTSLLGEFVTVKLDNGRTVKFNAKKYRHLRRAYAVTTYRAQGSSVEVVFVYVGSAMQNLPASLVQVSRAGAKIFVFTQHRLFNPKWDQVAESELAAVMGRRVDVRLATDLLENFDYLQDAADPKYDRNRKKRVKQTRLPAIIPNVTPTTEQATATPQAQLVSETLRGPDDQWTARPSASDEAAAAFEARRIEEERKQAEAIEEQAARRKRRYAKRRAVYAFLASCLRVTASSLGGFVGGLGRESMQLAKLFYRLAFDSFSVLVEFWAFLDGAFESGWWGMAEASSDFLEEFFTTSSGSSTSRSFAAGFETSSRSSGSTSTQQESRTTSNSGSDLMESFRVFAASNDKRISDDNSRINQAYADQQRANQNGGAAQQTGHCHCGGCSPTCH